MTALDRRRKLPPETRALLMVEYWKALKIADRRWARRDRGRPRREEGGAAKAAAQERERGVLPGPRNWPP